MSVRRLVRTLACVISVAEYLAYVDRALDAMVEILAGLGDDAANCRPDVSGANSPYAIVTHCLGVMEFWGGEVVAGRDIVRDRDAEFRAGGDVADLTERVRAARRQLAEDLAGLEPQESPRRPTGDREVGITTQGGVLMHVYEELAQHLGHLELTRDLLVTGSRSE